LPKPLGILTIPLIIRGMRNVIVIDAEHDSKGEFRSLFALRKALQKEEGLNLSFDGHDNQSHSEFTSTLQGEKGFDPYDTTRSVFHLKVTEFQHGYISDKPEENSVNIIYVKLSLNADAEHMDATTCNISGKAYPCTVVAYYQKHNLNPDNTRKEKGTSSRSTRLVREKRSHRPCIAMLTGIWRHPSPRESG
jgi:hypothetical protein